MKILILRAELGVVKEKNIIEGELEKALKDTVIKALELWDPRKSDLIVMRHKQEIKVKLPITREQYEKYSQFNLKRKGDYASFDLPLFLISYDNEWREENIVDSGIFIVAPYIDDYCASEVEELAKRITSPEKAAEEEEEEELEEE
ncbi:MAG: DUF2286 domain-containing protein [Ignisphaera sp.]|nr:DUF2286 domain-containing protein [Ignisphaera sp.]